MKFRGLRGATTVDEDSEEAILHATRELLVAMIEANDIHEDDVASVIFTVTPDLTAAYPARAARELGWTQVALIDCQEMVVPGGMPRCIRVLIHWNTPKSNRELRHTFMRHAAALRPDLQEPQPAETLGTNPT
ncbi:MAG: chorismate mutase [Chloroflexi bacterium]|nr:chorismate mutase [Chloroflexota bacterium]